MCRIIHWDQVQFARDEFRARKQRIVMTNGCFDLLHVGHLRYLNQARQFGDLLWVGLNSDASVSQLKGPNRPVNSQGDRAELLAALRMVDVVTVFEGIRSTALIHLIQPEVYVKGGDYTVETLDPGEREALIQYQVKIEIVPLVAGKSTTSTLERIRL